MVISELVYKRNVLIVYRWIPALYLQGRAIAEIINDADYQHELFTVVES